MMGGSNFPAIGEIDRGRQTVCAIANSTRELSHGCLGHAGANKSIECGNYPILRYTLTADPRDTEEPP